MDTLAEEAVLSSLFSGRSARTGKNLLPLEQILSFKSRLDFWKDYIVQGTKQEISKKLFVQKWQFYLSLSNKVVMFCWSRVLFCWSRV